MTDSAMDLRSPSSRSGGRRWLLLLAILACVANLSAQQGSAPSKAQPTGQPVLPTHSLSVTSRSTFTVNYDGFSQSARDAFQAAIDIWAAELDSPVPIRVDAFWKPLPPGPTGLPLAEAWAVGFARDFPNAPKRDTVYPIALANRLLRSDLTPGAPHIEATFNSDVAWYTGVDGHPGPGQYELLSVVLHEIAHGLGFDTGIFVDDSDPNAPQFFWAAPSVLDRFAYPCFPGGFVCENESVGDAYNPEDLNGRPPSQSIQSGNVWFDAQGTRARLHAPGSWESGSSLSHLDEVEYYGVICDPLCHLRLNSLMTPAQPAGVSIQDIGPLARSLLREVGWFTPFTKISPVVDQTFPDTVNPTLQWGPSEGAANYQYCVSLVPNSCSGAWTSVGKNLSVTLSGLAADTTYYWQVKAQNGNWSEEADVPPDSHLSTGEWRAFHITYHSNVNGPFTKSAPVNLQVVSGASVTLQWTASLSQPAFFYYWCVDTIDNNSCDGTWTQTFVLSGGQILFPTVSVLPGTKYYWQAVAGPGAAPSADAGRWWSFQVPGTPPGTFFKATPGSFSIVPGTYTTLAWAPSNNAETYEYCIDEESTNDSVCQSGWKAVPAALNVTTGITEAPTFAAVGRLLPSMRYFWNVRARNAGGTTEANAGSWWRFDTSAALPGSFSKTSPLMRATQQPSNVPLRWEAASGSTSYRVCVDTTNNGACEEGWTSVGTSLSITALGLAYSTTYYWQIEALNAQGTTAADGGAWFRFTTLGAPKAFSKTTPANSAGSQGSGLELPLVWNSSDNGAAYRFCVDTVPDDTCNTSWTDVGSSRNASLAGLIPETTYYWQVEAQNIVGTTAANGGAWWSFRTVGVAGSFGKSSPANLSTGRPTSLSLVWQSSADAGGYEYCIDNSNDNACAASWIAVGANQSAALTDLAPGTSYYWQVRSRNTVGTTTADGSSWWSFTTAAPTPVPSVVTLAATNVTIIGATLNGIVNPNGSSTTVAFEYGQTASYGAQVTVSPAPGSGTSPVAVSRSLAGSLSCNTEYHFRVVATNTGGTAPGSDVTFRTAACPSGAPVVVSLPATSVTASRAKLNGTVNPNGNGTTAFFELGLTTSYGRVGTMFQLGPLTFDVTLDNSFQSLVCGTLHHFRLVATNAFGTTSGADVTFTTTPCPPPAPPLVRTGLVSNITAAGGAILNARLNPNGLNTIAVFEYGPTTTYGNQVAVSPSPGSGSFWVSVTAALTGLSCNVDYHFRVVASNSSGTSVGSDSAFQACRAAPFAPGTAFELDPTFGTGGRNIVTFPGAAVATDMALQPDGKAVVVGSVLLSGVRQLALARFNGDGTLDASFGIGGTLTNSFFSEAGGIERFATVGLQPDGRIVVAGSAAGGGFAVARFLANGQPDPAFGVGGLVRTVQGTSHKYSVDPPLDPCVPLVAAYGLAFQPDGRIVVVGKARQFIPLEFSVKWGPYFNDDFAVVRYNPDGSLDSSFSPRLGPGVCPSTSGVLIRSMDYPFSEGLPLFDSDFASSVIVLSDGKILVGGWAGFVDTYPAPGLRNPSLLLRLWPDGQPDAGFSISPQAGVIARSNDAALPNIGSTVWTRMERQSDGRIFRLEQAGSFGVVGRQHADGRPDSTFGDEGILTAGGTTGLTYKDLAVTNDVDVVLVGQGGAIQLRIIPDGGISSSFSTADFPGASGAGIVLQPDGRFLIAGTAPVNGSTGFLVERMFIATRAPVVVAPPVSQVAAEGQDVVFTVTASGVPASYQWQGFFNGSWGNIGDQAPYWTGTQTGRLTVHADSFMNGYQFRCIVTNVWGWVMSVGATLTVGVPIAPAIIEHPASQIVRVGQNASFGVTATGSQPRSYQWQLSTNGGASWTNATNAAPHSGATTSNLLVTAAPRTLTGARYRCIVSNVAGSVTSNAATLVVEFLSSGDFDGDHKAEIGVFRRSTGTWYIRYTGTPTALDVVWGGGSDIPVVADYDGDGKTDIAVFRPSTGTWYIRYTATPTAFDIIWGGGSDVSVVADYDGDGKADIAVFRPSTGTWYIRYTATPTALDIVWGGGSDIPVVADYDGDGKADIAVFRQSTGTWYIRYTATPTALDVIWGGGTDIPVVADYDGDGKADIAVFRRSTGTWYIRYTATPTAFDVIWGGGSDIPVSADYDGDGKADIAVFRPSTGTWYIRYTATPTAFDVIWGGGTDIPVLQQP